MIPQRILVVSRRVMMGLDPDFRYVVLSITDPAPFGEPAKIPQRWGGADLVRLEFMDFDCTKYHASVLKKRVAEKMTFEQVAMQPWQGDIVWEFLLRARKLDVEGLVVHCEAGVSRSPSVAMAVADCLHVERKSISWADNAVNERPPNSHVYKTVCEAFERRKQ